MKKQVIQLVVALVLLAGALGAFLLLRGQEDEPSASSVPAQETVYVLGGVPQPFVRKVEIRNTVDAFTIENGFANAIEEKNNAENAEYSIPGLAVDSLNQSMLKSILTAAGNLPAKKLVAESGADLALYGLNDPEITLTATYETGSATLQVGDEAPGGEGVYVALGEKVYLIDTTRVTNLRGSRLSFVNKTITPGTAESAQFETVTLSGAKYPEPIAIRKTEDSESAKMAGLSSYIITAPIQVEADSERGITPLASVFGLAAQTVVDSAQYGDAKSAEYGLDTPWIVVDAAPLAVEGQDPIAPFTIAFSQADEDGNVYAQTRAGNYIYQLPVSSLPFYELSLFNLQTKTILLPNIDTVSAIDVLVGGTTRYAFTLEGEGDELAVKMDGKELDTENFRQFYRTLISASYESEIPSGNESVADAEESESAPDAESTSDAEASAESSTEASESAASQDAVTPELPDTGTLLQYNFHYRDNRPDDFVTFQPGPVRRAVVSLNGGRTYYILSKYVEKALEDVEKISRGEKVTAYL